MGLFWFRCLIYSSSRSQDINSGFSPVDYCLGPSIGTGSRSVVNQRVDILGGYVIGCGKYPGLIRAKSAVAVTITALVENILNHIISN